MQFKLMLLMAVAISALGVSCTSGEASSSATTTMPPQKLPVDIKVVNPIPLHLEMVVVGSVEPFRSVDIVSEVPKRITRIAFKDGSSVQQGQLLYKLDDADLKAQLKRLESELKLAKVNESRLANLLQTETVRPEEYDIALAKLEALQADAELLQVALSKTEIKAPFSGQIGITKAHVGSLVSSAVLLVTLQDQSRLKIRFSIPEKYQNFARIGHKITFSIDGANEKYPAVITATEPSIDEQNRSIAVQATISNLNKRFKAGQSAKIYFPVSEKQATGIKVPTEALIPGANGYAVFTVKNGVAKMTPVSIGNRSESEALITGGLSDGDTLMISNILRAGEGTPVQVMAIK